MIRFRAPDDPSTHSRLIDAFVDDTSLALTESAKLIQHDEMISRMGKNRSKLGAAPILFWSSLKPEMFVELAILAMAERAPSNEEKQIQLHTQGMNTNPSIMAIRHDVLSCDGGGGLL